MVNAYFSDRRRGNISVIISAAASPITWPDKLVERKGDILFQFMNKHKNDALGYSLNFEVKI